MEQGEWRQEEDTVLAEMLAQGLTDREIGKRLDRPMYGVKNRRLRLGLLRAARSDNAGGNPAREDVRRMTLAGKSKMEIAVALGLTRSAVSGLQSRMGLTRKRPEGFTRPIHQKRAPQPKALPAPVAATEAPAPRVVVDVAGTTADGLPVGVLDLERSMCRWPCGDPLEPGFGFCAAPIVAGKPYCAHHHARAWDAARTQRSKAKPDLARVEMRRQGWAA